MLPAVYSKDLEFLPMGSQIPDETGCRFAVGQHQMLPGGVKPVYDDILVAKMRPGQVIQLEAHCIKGDPRMSGMLAMLRHHSAKPECCFCSHTCLSGYWQGASVS